MYERLVRNKEKAFFTYPSYDKYLFYQEHRKSNLDFWEQGIVYNYNIGCKYPDDLNPTEYKSDYKTIYKMFIYEIFYQIQSEFVYC